MEDEFTVAVNTIGGPAKLFFEINDSLSGSKYTLYEFGDWVQHEYPAFDPHKGQNVDLQVQPLPFTIKTYRMVLRNPLVGLTPTLAAKE